MLALKSTDPTELQLGLEAPHRQLNRRMSSSQSPNSSTITSRLNQIKNQTMGSISSPSVFTANVVPQAAEDPLFGLMAAYKKDSSDKKVDLGIGAYRDDNAKPWVLPVVKKVCSPAVGFGIVCD